MLSSLAKPLRAACPSASLAGPSTIAKRTAASVAPPYAFPGKAMPRKYPERKRFKVDEYTRLLSSSKTHPLILFRHIDFSVPRLLQLRKDIAAAALKHAPKPKPSLAALTPARPHPHPNSPAPPPPLPQFVIASTAFFGVALRQHPDFDDTAREAIAQMAGGTLAVLTFPELNPPQLLAVLAAVARAVPPRGARPRAAPDLALVGAVIEGRAVRVEDVRSVAQLPDLETLRAQIVGLLSAPAGQLSAVLGEAGGAKLARTLKGLEKSLEEGQSDAPPP
ncbi:uncharacterized protein PHACADRAFT_135308 [Phanerochaete carnosa HHB-10118-sp]|uniref:Ribosomal protein L10 n=1 Tax=Phanerochaete carnosa (strain HHB-10118-sp) TaxID=650164 RepID=K5VEU6_PHACS|nr:uncharacterized protein PHACADRAFT_135308 [Phanerochaete carnosa HHB-10118-sp]EKM61551.1 hypothetical protein PHACADRAFT_135308 [Phanerochaete carnosa HHB-10118-sp]